MSDDPLSGDMAAFVARQLQAPCPPAALAFAETLVRETGARAALFYGSITYLPLLWIAMVANKL